MKKLLSTLLLSGAFFALTLQASPQNAAQKGIAISQEESMASLLFKYKGKRVSLQLASGSELSGTITTVTNNLVKLKALKGREFYDAVISISSVQAIIVRAK